MAGTAAINPGYWGRGRALHVIDLENLIGRIFNQELTRELTRELSRLLIAEAWTTYERGIGIQNGDRALVVVSNVFARATRAVLPPYVRLQVCKVEPDAADDALKRLAEAELNRTSFAMVIIASGDHRFAETADLARSRKLKVWLVSGRGAVARKLAACCPLRSQLRLSGEGHTESSRQRN